MIERKAASTFVEKDQNWQDESTTYWFDVENEDGETVRFGIVEQGTYTFPVDEDGQPIDYNEVLAARVVDVCRVTDEMRQE